jgi:glucose/mannose-6-phosphate isomerase
VTEKLDDLVRLSELDERGMLNILGRFDRQLEEAVGIGESASLAIDAASIRLALISGLGGSAIGGDFLRAYLGKSLRVPLLVNRGYTLPGFVDKSTLVILSSYSGNTEETISAFEEARAAGARMICITSGGQIERMAEESRTPRIKIPAGYPPRSALGYSAIPTLVALGRLGLAPERAAEVRSSIAWVRRKIALFAPECPLRENQAKGLAKSLHRKIPVIYGSQDRLDAVAVRWRCQFSENGKQLAYSASLPEMNHNEIVGWKHPAPALRQVMPVFLRDHEDHPRVQIRAEITRDILADRAGAALEFWTDGETWLERLWTLVLLGDYASVYLAFLNQEDPTPVDAIEGLKNRLKESA